MSTSLLPSSTDVLVIGAGIAGLSAAVSAAERFAEGAGGRVLLIDRASELEAGGNTRWTSAYLRLDDVYEPGEHFVRDVLDFSDGRTPASYVERLVELLPETMDWAQGHGMRFRRQPTYFINSVRKRQQPVGGGEAMRRALEEAARRLGVTIEYDVTATGLVVDVDDAITGVEVVAHGEPLTLSASAVVIASGGFEGDPAWLERELGAGGSDLPPVAPGGRFNRGEVLAAALDLGARRAGQWDSFHAEPIDPRSTAPEALVMIFPYGIVVNARAERFMDEGRGTVDETYEGFARSVWKQEGGIAYFITDGQILSVEDRERGVLTSAPPVTADTLEDLAEALDLPPAALRATVDAFNAATHPGEFDWKAPDGLGTTGIEPPKSNWAVPLENPPYLAYPVRCSICFTFGGLATDLEARVVRDDDTAIEGLYAAGECTGLYFGKYPGGTSVMRGLVFGKVAGAAAAASAAERREVAPA